MASCWGLAGTLLTIGGATLDPGAVAALCFGGTIVAIAGSVIVTWTVGNEHPSHHVLAILLGSLTTSLVLLLAASVLERSPQGCFSDGASSCCPQAPGRFAPAHNSSVTMVSTFWRA